jgi:hypothetical protein
MKAISRRLGVFKFCGRNPKIIGRRLTHVTTPHRNNSSNSGRPRKHGLNNKLKLRGNDMANHAATVSFPTDNQILIVRDFNAPADLVFTAWTQPELIKRWWSGGFGEVTVVQMPLREGALLALRDDDQRRPES